MALTVNHPMLKETRVHGFIADSSAASSSAFAWNPIRGKIVKLIVVAGAAVDSDRVVTCKINGTAITGGAITMTAAASAAGSTFTAVPTAAYSVNEDDYISFESDGAGATACPTHCVAVVQMA